MDLLTSDSERIAARGTAEILDLAVQCIRLFQARSRREPEATLEPAVESLRTALTDRWQIWAEVFAAAEDDCYADPANPGYIVRRADGEQVRVPCHLAGDFPSSEDLRDLVRVARLVRVTSEGIICISGSATFLRSLCWAADLDYCEYADTRRVLALHEALLVRRELSEQTVVCVGVVARGFTNEEVELGSGLPIARAKLDFLACTDEANDVVEATNVLLPVADDRRSLEHSFALQEAPLGDGTWLPQDLLDPTTFGRYALWLFRETAKKVASNDVVKAAKRGLSLARLCGLDGRADEIIRLLRAEGCSLRAAREARENLRQMVGDRAPWLSAALERTIERMRGVIVPVAQGDSIGELREGLASLCALIAGSVDVGVPS